jgi:hypothetical protein
MRNLVDVIKQILEIVPKSEHRLCNQLSDIMESASCAAPEIMPTWWGVAQKAIFENIDVNTEFVFMKLWEQQVISVWSTKSIEELKKQTIN